MHFADWDRPVCRVVFEGRQVPGPDDPGTFPAARGLKTPPNYGIAHKYISEYFRFLRSTILSASGQDSLAHVSPACDAPARNAFREVGAGGEFGLLRNTLLTFGGETRELAFMADNPGDGLFHCHMLSHAASGMMAWMKVV